jgi:hypothetical protein
MVLVYSPLPEVTVATETDNDSGLLSKDPFDVLLHSLVGRPNGAHVPPSTVQHISDYRHVTAYSVQTVRTELGATIFIEQTSAAGFARYILPPKVLALMDRQRETATAQIRRRHGRRLAEERGLNGRSPFTPEMREKAAAARKRNAAKRKKKGGRA